MKAWHAPYSVVRAAAVQKSLLTTSTLVNNLGFKQSSIKKQAFRQILENAMFCK